MVGLFNGEKNLRIRITVLTEYRRVTDRRTSCNGIVLAMHTRRAVKTLMLTYSTSCAVFISEERQREDFSK